MPWHEFSNKEVTTRKPHTCGWCGVPIQKGERARARSYVWQDGLGADWMHPECATAMETYPEQQDLWDGWSPGCFARGSHDDA